MARPCACFAGLVTEVRLPAPDGPQDVGAALGGGHAVRAGRHAAFLRHQHDREGGQGHHRVSSSPALSVLVPEPDPIAPKLGGLRQAQTEQLVSGAAVLHLTSLNSTPRSGRLYSPDFSSTFSKSESKWEQWESKQMYGCRHCGCHGRGCAAGDSRLCISDVTSVASDWPE